MLWGRGRQLVGVWRRRGCGGGGGGAGLTAFVLRFVLFFDFVVDVFVVQVVIWCLARCCARQEIWSRQCSPWCSAVVVLEQGGVMPVVATRGAWDLTGQKLWWFRSCSVDALLVQFIDGCGRMHRRRFACSSWTRLTCPLMCNAKCAVYAAMSSTPLSWRRRRFPWSVLPQRFSSCSTLTR